MTGSSTISAPSTNGLHRYSANVVPMYETYMAPVIPITVASAAETYEYTPGSDLYVVYSDGRDTATPQFPALQNRSFAIKVTRLFRL